MTGQNYLRGVQEAWADGVVTFQSAGNLGQGRGLTVELAVPVLL